MNDICKGEIRDRLLEALKKEGITTNLAGGMLKINPAYLSMVKNSALWFKMPEKDWEVLQKWCNSGMGIAAYGNSGGKLVAGKVIIIPASSVEDVTESHSENVASKRFVEAVAKADADLTARMQSTVFPEIMPEAVIPEKIVPEKEVIREILQSEKDGLSGFRKYQKSAKERKTPAVKEEPQSRVSDARLVYLLMEEKQRLQGGIDAIDSLLEIYTK